jgi:hypothetical protein
MRAVPKSSSNGIYKMSVHSNIYQRFVTLPKVRTSPAKTVADCFKYRNKIGLDVALEALTEYHRKRGSVDALMQAATADRVAVVLRPYLEAIA